jgi:hypothetical protein
MFTFPITQGDARNPLPHLNAIAISERVAKKHFPGEDALGKILHVDQKRDHVVTAVFADVPKNSELQFDYVIPFGVWRNENQWVDHWGNTGMQMLASLKPGTDPEQANQKVAGLIRKNCSDCHSTVFLFPYTKLRLYGTFDGGHNTAGRIDYILSLSLVAVIILVIACINFMNLATARAATRSREVGVRKVIGAKRLGLIVQFTGESVVLSFIALAFSLMLVQVFLPFFNTIAGKSIVLNFADPLFLTGILAITILSGLLAGSYPAFFLSSFNPAKVLKGTTMLSGGRLRKTLVVVQFVASTVLTIGSIIVYNQIEYIRNVNLGFNKENVIILDQFDGVLRNQDAFRQELLQNPSVTAVSFAGHHPFNIQQRTTDPSWPGKNEEDDISFNVMQCDHAFVPLMDMTLLDGRNFTDMHRQDSTNVLVNEQAMRAMGFTRENIIGTTFTMWGKTGKVIGLVKDFNNLNLREAIAPQVFLLDQQATWRVFIKIKGPATEALRYIEQIKRKYDPAYPFEYAFLDEEFNKEYRSEEVTGKLSLGFTVIAVLISCLGLFGLASFTAERRMKELGIRKVFGASPLNLVTLLCGDFTKLVIISLLIGCPAAWYLAAGYLARYTFHPDLNASVFLIAATSTLLIALLTVLYQSLKASVANPVDSLRSE